jgi:hypothetical protein
MHKARGFLARIGFAVAGAIAAVGMSGCSTFATTDSGKAAQPVAQTAVEKTAALAFVIDKHCQVAVPFLASLKAVQTDPGALALLDRVSGNADKVCAVAALVTHPPEGVTAALDLAAVQTFASSEIPKLLTVVRDSKLDDQYKASAILAITGAQLALLNGVVASR